jgi:hypothetical protein
MWNCGIVKIVEGLICSIQYSSSLICGSSISLYQREKIHPDYPS